ncbi:MAG: type II secretion system protein [Granulosicoccus sp.]
MILHRRFDRGFTLVELAIVLLIVGLLSKSILKPVALAQERQRYHKNKITLQLVKESLLAHVVAKGTLPCPIPASHSYSVDSDVVCNIGQGGIPAAMLGIEGAVDEYGALLDEWNRTFLYAVSLKSHAKEGDEFLPDWTSVGEASAVGIPNLRGSLALCTQAVSGSCPMSQIRANELAFVVVSFGEKMISSGLESENSDGDNIFIAAEYSIEKTTAFDDQIVWSSAQEVMYWMLRAAWLP